MEHGYQGRYIEGYELAEKYNLKFVFGAEAYWVKDRTEKDRSNCHIYIGAKNENGRQAINDILSEANITGFYSQARIDIPLIMSLPKDDVIVTTACVAYWKYDDIESITRDFANHFGKNFFFEVQYHNTQVQAELNSRILRLHNELKVPLIMGCDSHYIFENQAQNRTDFLHSKNMFYPDEEGWFLDYPDGDTAYNRFAKQGILSHSEICDAMDNTNVFLDVEEYDNPIFNTKIKMPTLYPNWTQEQRDKEYERLVWQGWDDYKSEVPIGKHEHYKEEIQKEIDTVVETKMADYFIDNYHIIKQGKENGGWLTKSGRGSAVSFITNKLLGFTEVDRIAAKVKMYPERFMSATRILQSGSLPDIDFNVANIEPFARAQQEILGEDHAYPMIAYGTMQKSAAWKLYAKSQGVPFEVANEVSDRLRKYEIAVKHADDDEKDNIAVEDYIGEQYLDIYNKSKDYLGTITSWSIAPCSYLLYQGSIRKEVGLVKVKDHLCCLMDGHWAESGHFLKNDLLKVSVVELIFKTYQRLGMEPHSVNELLKLCPPEDEAWSVYKKGCTLGINQVEKAGTSSRVRVYAPQNISELCAFVAAIRPGFKSMYKTFEGRKAFSYGIKAFDALLQTEELPYSFCLYQEQEMAALNYAGIEMSDCYTAIKNIAKKRAEKVLAYKSKFINGFKNVIINDEHKSEEEAEELADKLWQIIEDSSRYSFNCISGETKIQKVGYKNGRYIPTIAEMFAIKNDEEYAKKTHHHDLYKKYKNNGYGYALSMFSDNRIKKNRIIDIVYSGVQKTYEVKTKTGKSIKCTMNHSFPTPEGKKKLSELKIGDSLYCKDKYEVNHKKYNFTDGNFQSNFPVAGQMGFQTNENGDSVVFYREREKHVDGKDPCEQCGKEYNALTRFELHHKDFDRTNNTPDNYQWLCVSCHKKEHFKRGRVKIYEKGIPTYIDEIVSITLHKTEPVFDVEMEDPAHTFISENGLVVSNCSHSYCVSVDSLYGAWLKSHHPLEFYETYLRIQEAKGDKDKMNAAKEEAEDYFGIKFPPFRLGQDNRSINANIESKSITNSLSSIKGFGASVGKILYECGQEQFDYFFDVLKWLDVHSMKSSKVIPLVKIDYFQKFGNNRELLRLVEIWDWLNQGTAKSIKKDKLNEEMTNMIKPFANDKGVNGNELKSYNIKDMNGLLSKIETTIFGFHLEELDYKTKAANQYDCLGYVDLTTGQEEDRRKLYILDLYELPDKFHGGVWKYKLKTKSVGSGKVASLSVAPATMRKLPVSKGDVIYAASLAKDRKGYWELYNYKILI